MKSILDAKFKYTPAARTDIGATFRKIMRARERAWDDAHAENAARELAIPPNVKQIRKAVKS